jgi:ribonuclease BN (tRNA processing enzyme)
MPKAHFLGTSGWYTSPTGYTVCTLVEYSCFNLVLDAGDGFSKLPRVIDFEKPTYIFLSHLHLDHISGLHTLMKCAFQKDLHILISKKSEKALKAILDIPYTAPIALFKEYLNYEIEVAGLPTKAKLPFRITALPVAHTVETAAARIEADGRVLSYVVDTGVCDNAVAIARDADLLITECAYRSGESNSLWPHLSPETAAGIAKRAEARRLVLTHFDASRYDSAAKRKRAERIARSIFSETTASRDGLAVEF